jgi:hypothetical protein
MPLHKGKRARILGRDLTPLARKSGFRRRDCRQVLKTIV